MPPMPAAGVMEILRVYPSVRPPLDPGFVPAALANRRYRALVESSRQTAAIGIALERERGVVCRHDLRVLAPGSAHDADTLLVLERHVKCLLWTYGGWRLRMSGPAALCEPVLNVLSSGGPRAFDAAMMGRTYDRPFDVGMASPGDLPEASESHRRIGGHLDGCRIGIDLGASDYKVAAVIEGETVFSEETPWNPAEAADPRYHYAHITAGLKRAAAHLPRVNAIGGSSAGIWVENRVKAATLFRSVPADVFPEKVSPIFLRIGEEWGVPVVVVNDGDVSALAGSMALGSNPVLGIAMGSSQAGGYIDRRGCITGRLSELAFVPVDFGPEAAHDAWARDRGVGSQYFSQQAVNRLARAAGMEFAAGLSLPERLVAVQARAGAGDATARDVFATIGVYLGYALAHYADYYDVESVLILGRVTSGCGGDLILENAREVLRREFGELNRKVTVRLPDEKTRRVGQAVAAASLPEIRREGEFRGSAGGL